MSIRDPLAGVPALLWRFVLRARHRLLLMDYDGTLAPFVEARHDALMPARTREVLQRISGSGRTELVIVTGRPLGELQELVDGVSATLVGEDGWEQQLPSGELLQRPLEPSIRASLEKAARVVEVWGHGGRLERKRSGLVLHTRSLDPVAAQALEERCIASWSGLMGTQLVIARIDGGVELRARGRNKGTVVLSQLSHSPADTLGVFVGDDLCDEDAFEVVRDQGFGIRVGDPEVPSLAQGRLGSVSDVSAFLEEWLRVTESIRDPLPRVY